MKKGRESPRIRVGDALFYPRDQAGVTATMLVVEIRYFKACGERFTIIECAWTDRRGCQLKPYFDLDALRDKISMGTYIHIPVDDRC